MKKKILSLFYILALELTAYAASAPELPPSLPVIEEPVSQDTKSFWDKTLGFFGFNEEVKKKDDITPEKQVENPISNLEDKNNSTKDTNLNSPLKEPTNITKEPLESLVDNSKKNETPNNFLSQKAPDITDLKLPDGIKPDEESLPIQKPATEISGNTIPISQPLAVKDVSKETKPEIADLKLPDGIKPDDEGLPAQKPATEISGNTIPISQPLATKDVSKETTPEIADLKLPDGIKPDDESLPAQKPATEISGNTIPISQPLATKDVSKETTPEIADLKLPDGIKLDDESLSNQKPATKILDNTIPSSQTIAANESVSIETIEIKKVESPLIIKKTSEQETNKPSENLQSIQVPTLEVTKNTDDLNVKSYRKHLQERLNKPKKLPEILKGDLNPTPVTNNIDPQQIKFVTDESQVLLLPNDEVVLGEVTTESRLDLMDLNSYLKIFWDNYNNIKDEPARQSINHFIENYDSTFHKQSYSQKVAADILIEAFKAIDKNSIYDLMNLLDNYPPILQLVDHAGNSLLHKSVYKNNYSAVKFLIMKGIDISVRNNQNLTALEIAVLQKKPNIENLLRSAGAR